LLAKGNLWKSLPFTPQKQLSPSSSPRVEAGEEILLARGKQPIAKLVPFRPEGRLRKFGALKGTVTVSQEFFDTLPEHELDSWE